MPSIEKEPIYDVYCISRRQYQRFLNIFFWDVSVAQLVASLSGVVLGGVAEVVGSNLARGKIFTASLGSVDSLYPSVCIYDVYCISRRQYQRFLNILFWGCLSGAVDSVGVCCSARRCCRGRGFYIYIYIYIYIYLQIKNKNSPCFFF